MPNNLNAAQFQRPPKSAERQPNTNEF